ncbi:hypothetical protein [Staphylococcus hominis]|uniref:hypothetical protein n=1 Tax=Staphylococcus hominis TaxID=1290 RepID=UPI00066B9AD1|nr:hypothetical protein [Staphylococcus hominis]MDS3874858.1 hypothetical protein [Staphylococcus hominis]DAI85697.1 MAG TPA: Helicase loader, Phage protein complex, PROTEIN BINDING [Caudoviricetes sp.]
MVTIDNVKQILECKDMYAQKMIRWANGDEKALVDLINQKLEEKRVRAAIVEVF